MRSCHSSNAGVQIAPHPSRAHENTQRRDVELRGKSISERTRRLIAIAHPNLHDDLTWSAKDIGYL
jgi:Acetyl-CoA hydrolase/transferase C-terminal domain